MLRRGWLDAAGCVVRLQPPQRTHLCLLLWQHTITGFTALHWPNQGTQIVFWVVWMGGMLARML